MAKFLCSLVLGSFSLGCVSTETIKSSEVSFSTIHAEYRLSQTEADDDEVTVNLQFRVGGPTGTTVEFDEGELFTVNGQNVPFINGGSQTFNTEGSYYQTVLEVLPESESVDIIFKDKNGVENKEVVERARPIHISSVADGDTVDISQNLSVDYTPDIAATGRLIWRELTDASGNYVDHTVNDDGVGTFEFPAQAIAGKNVSTIFLTAFISENSEVAPEGFEKGDVTSSYNAETLTLKPTP